MVPVNMQVPGWAALAAVMPARDAKEAFLKAKGLSDLENMLARVIRSYSVSEQNACIAKAKRRASPFLCRAECPSTA